MTGYPCAPNEVEFSFETSLSIPQALTIYQQVDLEWVREKVRENPFVTLKQLSDFNSETVRRGTEHLAHATDTAARWHLTNTRKQGEAGHSGTGQFQ